MAEMSFDQFARELGRMQREVLDSAEVAINESLEDLLSAAQALSPLDEGGHTESGSVNPISIGNGAESKGQVGFSKEYSLRLHEDVYNLGETSAQKPDFDGMKVGRKYLSRPLDKYAEKYINHIVSKIEGDL
jgi:hypothetical protein